MCLCVCVSIPTAPENRDSGQTQFIDVLRFINSENTSLSIGLRRNCGECVFSYIPKECTSGKIDSETLY